MADATTETDTRPKGRRARAKSKLADARHSAIDRARSTVSSIESNPVGVLVGGLTAGLVIGALIPRSKQEKKLLKPVGKRIAAGAAAALVAAKETGKEQLSASLLGREAVNAGARAVFDSAVKAAKSSGARDKRATKDA